MRLEVMKTYHSGYFQDPTSRSTAEGLLRAENGGAKAVWASSGLTAASCKAQINQAFLRELYGPGQAPAWADSVRAAKSATNEQEARQTWLLFADPTLRVR